MSRVRNTMGRGLFGLAVLGALAFGARQAAAAPTSTQAAGSCTYSSCRSMCNALGSTGGYCYYGHCLCD